MEYSIHDRDILVTACGRICMHRKKNNLHRARRPKGPPSKQVDDGIWLISSSWWTRRASLQVGNADGMALLIAIANRHVGELSDDTLKIAVADGIQVAFWLAAAGKPR